MPDFDPKTSGPLSNPETSTGLEANPGDQIAESNIGDLRQKPQFRAEVANVKEERSQLQETQRDNSSEKISDSAALQNSTDPSVNRDGLGLADSEKRELAVETIEKLIHEPGSDLESLEILLSTLPPEDARELLSAYREIKGIELVDVLSKQFQRKDVELVLAVATDDSITESILEINQILAKREIETAELVAILETLTPEESARVVTGYREKYSQDLLDSLDSRLGVQDLQAINTALRHPTTSAVHSIHEVIAAEIPDVAALKAVLESLPSEQLPKVLSQYEREYGHSLDAAIRHRFRGSQRFDSLVALNGHPNGLDEEVARIQALIAYEQKITPPLTRQLLKRYHGGHDPLQEEQDDITSYYEKVREEDSFLPLPALIPLHRAIQKADESIPSLRIIRSTLADHASGVVGIFFGLLIFWIFVRSERSFFVSLTAGLVAFYFAQFTSRNIFEDWENDGEDIVEDLRAKKKMRKPSPNARPARRKRGRRARRVYARYRPRDV